MKFLSEIKRWFSKRRPKPLEEWFFVSFNQELVTIEANPQGKAAWVQSFRWDSIERVCFKDEGPYFSDGLYIFTNFREESYVVPIEAKGGSEFFHALHDKGYFPKQIMSKAVASTDGAFYCWPEYKESKRS